MINLPLITFINGAPQCGKSTLMRLLQKNVAAWGICPMSFKSPAQRALISTHYARVSEYGLINLEDISVRKKAIDSTGITHEEWIDSFIRWMKQRVGAGALGDILRREILDLKDSWRFFLLDDLWTEDDARPIAQAFGRENCLIIHLRRHGCTWAGGLGDDVMGLHLARHIGIDNNGKPEDMLDRLEQILGTLKDPAHSIEGFEKPLR